MTATEKVTDDKENMPVIEFVEGQAWITVQTVEGNVARCRVGSIRFIGGNRDGNTAMIGDAFTCAAAHDAEVVWKAIMRAAGGRRLDEQR